MEKYDLIVAGTGFASSFFLKKYLEKSSPTVRVLVLERGVMYSHADRIGEKKGKLPAYFSDVKDHTNTIANHTPAKPWVFSPNFGGGSNCWWGATLRFMPNDFRTKSLYQVGEDWPLTYDELEPYYTEAESIMAVSGPELTAFRRTGNYPLPAHALSTVDRLMQKHYGAELYFSQPTARASRSVNGRGACCSSYTCSVCPVNAKFTIENGMESVYRDPRVQVVYKAVVEKLDIEGGKVTGVQYTQSGKEVIARGDLIALGANAIFNAHILRASGDENPFLGKGISEQKGFFVNVYLHQLDNVGGGSAMTANAYMHYDGEFRKEHAGWMLESHNAPIIRAEHGKWRHLARFKFVFEDLPDYSNEVRISEDKQKPYIHYRNASVYVDKGREKLMSMLDKIFAPLPVESIFPDDGYQETEYHILGTARMSADGNNGVVDSRQIHHKYRNVFVLGGSSFPTITAANPTLTIAALSLRSAGLSF